MAVPSIQTAFSAGEIAPSLYGHVDLAKSRVAATTLRNCFVNYRGGAYSRAGTALALRSKQPYGTPPRIITFQYNNTQGYCLELGNFYMRVFSNGSPAIDTAVAITGITNASPAAVTAANSFSNGDWVQISGVIGMPQINGYTYIVAGVSGAGFTLTNLDGAPVDSTAFGPYGTGGTASRIYTLATPWAVADLPLLKFTQSADVMTFTHPSYPPTDLQRITATNWTITVSTFSASIAAPGSCSVTATVQPNSGLSPPTLPTAYAYQVTAVSATGEESVPSPIGGVTNSVDIAATAGSLVVTWGAVAAAISYNVYKAPASYNTQPASTTNALPVPAGAAFGYVGTAFGTQFVDSNITADFTQVPPQHANPFAPGQILAVTTLLPGSGYTTAVATITTSTGSGFSAQGVIVGGGIVAWIVINPGQNYAPGDTVAVTGAGGSGATASLTVGPQTGTNPGACAYFQQRRVYANSANNPNTYWMSKPGQFLNFDTSIPVLDDDAITGTPWAQQVNGVQWMVPMPGGLVTLTGLGAWQVTGSGGSALNPVPITPTSQQAQPQSFDGANGQVPPIRISSDILYVQVKGSYVYDLAYNYWLNNYTGTDLTQLSSHLFNNYQITQWAWCQAPYKIVWAARNDGTMLSLTFLKEQEVYGWARHDTLGQIVSLTAVTEPPVDALYLVAARYATSAGSYVYYVERMDNRSWTTSETPWCVDCGLAYPQPTPAATIYPTYNPGNGTGAVTASAPTFGLGTPGQVLRAGNGVATVTGYVSPTQVNVRWNTPPTNFVPNDPGGSIFPSAPGAWSLTTPTATVTGLQHLAGHYVTGLADGVPIPPTLVGNTGTITLATPASAITVGLAFTAQVQTPYLDTNQTPTIQGRRKTITAVTARVEASAGLQYGANQPDGAAQVPPQVAPTWSNMVVCPDQGATYTSPNGATVTQLWTGDLRIPISAAWDKRGQVAVQQTGPLPMQITAIMPETLDGDAPEAGYSEQPSQQKRGGEQQGAKGPGLWMLS